MRRVSKVLPDTSAAPLKASSFSEFVDALNPTLLQYEHVPLLVDTANRVVEGEIKRLLVLMPPRYFKSETFSRLLPAYALHRHPHQHVGLASYSASLAWDLSGSARQYFEEAGGQTAEDTDAKKEWANGEGGKMWADGVGGSLTGKGFHLGIIDDPMKPQHARSRAYIESFRKWYPETWYNRSEPGAAQIVVMQRLGANDPIDFLYRREVGKDTDAAPEHWHVLCLDERKSSEPLADYDGDMGLPPTCTLIHDDRTSGQILAPSRFNEDAVERQQRAAGVAANPQRQQRATDPTGDVWRTQWFQVYGTEGGHPLEELPDSAMASGYDWDTAYTKNEANSATAGVRSHRVTVHGEVRVYISWCDWRWVETPEQVAWMKRLGGPHYIEAKASGKSNAQHLRRDKVPVTEVQVDGGDKYARTTGVQPIVGYEENGEPQSTGRVYVHASIAGKLLHGDRQGLAHVTYEALREGDGDLDLNDAFVQALNRHAGNRRDTRIIGI